MKPARNVAFILLLTLVFDPVMVLATEDFCDRILSPQSHLKVAIEKGLDLYKRSSNIEESLEGQTGFLHGTSVQSLLRGEVIQTDIYLGSKISDFEMLANKFEIYRDHQAHHVFEYIGKTPIYNENNLRAYAALASFRHALASDLKVITDVDSFFLFDLFNVSEEMSVHDVYDYLYASYDEFDLAIPPAKNLKLLARKLKATHSKKGVIVVFKKEIEEVFPLEFDPEVDDAKVIISPAGLPAAHIQAIIPLSKNDEKQLRAMLR